MPQVGDCSHHARVRMQQRGIDSEALDLLLCYGRTGHNHRRCVLVYMDQEARRAALRDRGRAAGPVIDRVAGMYAVLGANGVVVTVCHRRRHIPRH